MKCDLRKILPNNKYRFYYNVSNIQNIDEITFSLEKDKQVIILSNKYMKNNYVIIYEKGYTNCKKI